LNWALDPGGETPRAPRVSGITDGRYRMRSKSDSQPSGTALANGYSLSRADRNGDGVSLAIFGEIDIANADAFIDEVHRLSGDADRDVVLDFQNCLFIDSTGIRALMVLGQEQKAQGRRLKLSGVTGEPQRVLELTGLLDSDLFASDGLNHPRRQP
jgi:anti-anti-sigma factor